MSYAALKTPEGRHTFNCFIREAYAQVNLANSTRFHRLIKTIADEGRLRRLYTQNFDCLDTGLQGLHTVVPLPRKAPWPKTVQLHGSIHHTECNKCGDIKSMDVNRFSGPTLPSCLACPSRSDDRVKKGFKPIKAGQIRPRILLYEDEGFENETIAKIISHDERSRPDALIVAGTALTVPGIQRMVRRIAAAVRRKNGVIIWINKDPPPKSVSIGTKWDVIVRGSCDRVAKYTSTHNTTSVKEE